MYAGHRCGGQPAAGDDLSPVLYQPCGMQGYCVYWYCVPAVLRPDCFQNELLVPVLVFSIRSLGLSVGPMTKRFGPVSTSEICSRLRPRGHSFGLEANISVVICVQVSRVSCLDGLTSLAVSTLPSEIVLGTGYWYFSCTEVHFPGTGTCSGTWTLVPVVVR